MTSAPYTKADLRAEAARQHATLTQDPDFLGIGEQMEGHKIPSRGDFQWDQLSDDDYDAARAAVDDLLTNAADVSEWAVQLGAAGLTPQPAMGWYVTTSGWDVAVQVATTDMLTDAARAELLTAIQAAVDKTVGRVLGLKPVEQTSAEEASNG
jgi:hypothetical protein